MDAPPLKRRRIGDVEPKEAPIAQGGIPFVILARTLTPWLWQRMGKLIDAGFDAHVVQDAPLPVGPIRSHVSQALEQERLHYIDDRELEAAGYHDINFQVTRKKMTAWERGLYWATTRSTAATGKLSSEAGSGAASGAGAGESGPQATWADRIFFAEDDAQWSDAGSLARVCRHIIDAPMVDLLAQKIAWSPKEDPGWPSWGAGFRYFKQEHLAAAFVPFCCLSARLLQEVRAFAAKHNTLIYLEVLFASLAKQHSLRVRWFQEAGAELPIASRWRPDFSDAEIERALAGFSCQPADTGASAHATHDVRPISRDRAPAECAAAPGSVTASGRSPDHESACGGAGGAAGQSVSLPAYPVLFHPIKRECAVWAAWESGKVMRGTCTSSPARATPGSAPAAVAGAITLAAPRSFSELLADGGYGDDI